MDDGESASPASPSPSTPSHSRAPSLPSPAPPSVSQFIKPKGKLVTYSRKRRTVPMRDDSPLSTPEVTPRKAAAAKAHRGTTSKSTARSKDDTSATRKGKKRSSPLPSPEPTPKRSRKPTKVDASEEDGDSPLTSPDPSDSESEASRESTPEAMPKRERRPTADARKETEVASSAPTRAKKRAAPRTSTPSAPSSSKPNAKRVRQSLPAKLPSRVKTETKVKEEGERFLDGEPSKPKEKPKRKRASTMAVRKAKSGFMSTDESEDEPVASSSQVPLSAKKTSQAKRVGRRGKNDPAAVFEKLQAAAAVNGSFSSLVQSSQTLLDEEDEDDMTLEKVLKRRSASLSPPPGSPTPSATPSKANSANEFVQTTLPMGVGPGSTCVVRQNHNFFVAVLNEFHPAQSPTDSDRYVVLERGSSKARTARKRDLVFLPEDAIATCSLGQYAVTVPERSADVDTDFVERVKHILPYIRLVLRDDYEPARWRSDLFWSSPATLTSLAEYGDLTEDETAEIGEIITEWVKGEKGTERFEALSEKEKRHYIQDVLVPEAAVGLVLASLDEEPWLDSSAEAVKGNDTNGEAHETDEPQPNGVTSNGSKDDAPTQRDTAKSEDAKDAALPVGDEHPEPSQTTPAVDAEPSEIQAAPDTDKLPAAESQPTADVPLDQPAPVETSESAPVTEAMEDLVKSDNVEPKPDPVTESKVDPSVRTTTDDAAESGQPTNAESGADSTAILDTACAEADAPAPDQPTVASMDAEAPVAAMDVDGPVAVAVAEHVDAEQVEAEQVEAEQVEAGQVAAEQVEAGQVAAEQAEAEQVEAKQVEAGQVAAEQVEAGQVAAEQAEAEQVEAKQVEAGQVAAGQVEAEQVAAGQPESEAAQAEAAAEQPKPEAEERANVEPAASQTEDPTEPAADSDELAGNGTVEPTDPEAMDVDPSEPTIETTDEPPKPDVAAAEPASEAPAAEASASVAVDCAEPVMVSVADEPTDVKAEEIEVGPSTAGLASAYASARTHLAELRAAAAHKQWAMRQTEVLRARRERRAALKLPSELETSEDRAEAGVADGTLGRSARGRVRRKVNYKDP